jgi:hypothetical protein
MSAIKHTPGPWDYVPGDEHHGPYVTSEFGSTICDCYFMGAPVDHRGAFDPIYVNAVPHNHMEEMAEANARLIAAAPELLSAAKMYMERVEVDGESNYQLEAYYALRAAIAKAEVA